MVRLKLALMFSVWRGAKGYIGLIMTTKTCQTSASDALRVGCLPIPTAVWRATNRGLDSNRFCLLTSIGGHELEGHNNSINRRKHHSQLSSSMRSSSNGDEHGAESPPAKGRLSPSATALAAAAVFFIIGVSTPWMGFAAGGGGVAAAGTEAEAAGFAPHVLAEEMETPSIKSYPEEFSKALSPLTTVRGVWRTRETRTDGSMLPLEEGKAGSRTRGICRGRLSFKGFVGAGKGTLEYRACGDREGKGRWLTKPKNIVNGRITLSARWKVNFLDGTSLLYRGDVVQDPEGTPLSFDASGSAAKGEPTFQRPDAHIRGEVLLPTTNVQGTLSERQIGEFEADLIELPSDDDRM